MYVLYVYGTPKAGIFFAFLPAKQRGVSRYGTQQGPVFFRGHERWVGGQNPEYPQRENSGRRSADTKKSHEIPHDRKSVSRTRDPAAAVHINHVSQLGSERER